MADSWMRWAAYHAPVIVCFVLIALLIVFPTGFEGMRAFRESDIRARARLRPMRRGCSTQSLFARASRAARS